MYNTANQIKGCKMANLIIGTVLSISSQVNKEGIVFVAHVNATEYLDEPVYSFLETKDLSNDVIFVDSDQSQEVCIKHFVQSIPSIVVFENGQLKEVIDNPSSASQLEKFL